MIPVIISVVVHSNQRKNDELLLHKTIHWEVSEQIAILGFLHMKKHQLLLLFLGFIYVNRSSSPVIKY